MPDSFRTFIAIELPSNIRWLATQHIERLRRELPDVRASWNREENLHLTLKFLGNVSVDRIPALSGALELAAKTTSPFELVVSGRGTFPAQGPPKVLWIGIGAPESGVSFTSSGVPSEAKDPSPPTVRNSPFAIDSLSLISLHSAVEAECVRAGFPPEARPFHPHLTIARLRSAKGARRLADLHRASNFAPQSFTVSEVVVFRSELLKEGSKHSALSRHKLGR